jgi:hypothetical protein
VQHTAWHDAAASHLLSCSERGGFDTEISTASILGSDYMIVLASLAHTETSLSGVQQRLRRLSATSSVAQIIIIIIISSSQYYYHYCCCCCYDHAEHFQDFSCVRQDPSEKRQRFEEFWAGGFLLHPHDSCYES